MKKHIWMFIAFGGLLATSSCSKIDDYRGQFQGDKEISYPGILDSAKVLAGNKRVMVYGLFTSDPKIVKYQVFWNGKQNMVEKTITRTSGVDEVKLIIDNLPEGGINFEVRTFDNKGNISIPVNISGTVFGDNYASAIVNRVFNPSTTKYDATSKILTIDWQGIDPTAIFTKVDYTDVNGQAKSVQVTDPSSVLTRINDYKTGTDIFYQTTYLPQNGAIDTFTVPKKDTFKR
jgi:hypothetical protein